MNILIIEDEYSLADAIASSLKSEHYKATINTNGEEGLAEALSGNYDLIILDVMLPDKDGFEILKILKKQNIVSKIIMLTARSNIDDKMNGFNNGADDYLTKPFHIDELIARINLQLHRNNENSIVKFGDLALDTKYLTLTNTNTVSSINIVGKEFELIELLIKNPHRVFEKEHLFNKIWGCESDSTINTLEAYISFLRKKLKLIKSSVNIKVIRGIGYKMEDKS